MPAVLLTGKVTTGAALGGALTLLISLGSAYLLGRAVAGQDEGSRSLARITAVAFVLQPYLLYDRFARSAVAELLALSFAPLLLAGLVALRRSRWWGLPTLAAGVALVVCSHNLMAFAMLGSTWVAALFLTPREGWGAWLARVAGASGLGLLLSSFYWVPMLWASRLVRLDEINPPFSDYVRHLVGFGGLHDPGAASHVGLFPLLVLAVLGLSWRVLAAADEVHRRLAIGSAAAVAAFVFLTTTASGWVWETATILQRFQFPWRLLGPMCVFLALCTASCAWPWVARASAARRLAIELAVFVIAVVCAVPALRQSEALPQEWAAEIDGVAIHGEPLRASGLPAVLGVSFVPRSATPAASAEDRGMGPVGRVLHGTGDAGVRLLEEHGTFTHYHVTSSTGTTLTFARWNFPGWEARLNQTPIETQTGPGGRLVVTLPAGDHELTLRYTNPPVRRVTTTLSALSALAWLGLLAWLWRRRSGQGG